MRIPVFLIAGIIATLPVTAVLAARAQFPMRVGQHESVRRWRA